MTICHFTTVHKLYDTRIFYKECRSLVEMGYNVILVSNHTKSETIDGIQIDPLPQYRSRFYSMFVKPWTAFRKCMDHKADIYYFHDPELIPVAFLMRILGKKVIYDVHEDVPKDIMDKEWIKPHFFKSLLSVIAELAEFIADLSMSGIIVVTEPIGKRFKNSKNSLVRNLPVLKMMDDIQPAEKKHTGKVVIYVGGLTRIRGILEVIKAMAHIDASLWLIGEWDDPAYEEECMAVTGSEKVKLYGFKKPVDAFSLLKIADAAVVNFLPAQNHMFALPNKPFEYMACRVPFVMSNFPYWKDLFKNYAFFADPRDPVSIAAQLNKLLGDSKLSAEMCRKGRTAVEEELCWELEVKKIDLLYKSIHG